MQHPTIAGKGRGIMQIETTDANKFDVWFAEQVADALNDALQAAEQVCVNGTEQEAVNEVLGFLAERFRLEVTP